MPRKNRLELLKRTLDFITFSAFIHGKPDVLDLFRGSADHLVDFPRHVPFEGHFDSLKVSLQGRQVLAARTVSRSTVAKLTDVRVIS